MLLGQAPPPVPCSVGQAQQEAAPGQPTEQEQQLAGHAAGAAAAVAAAAAAVAQAARAAVEPQALVVACIAARELAEAMLQVVERHEILSKVPDTPKASGALRKELAYLLYCHLARHLSMLTPHLAPQLAVAAAAGRGGGGGTRRRSAGAAAAGTASTAGAAGGAAGAAPAQPHKPLPAELVLELAGLAGPLLRVAAHSKVLPSILRILRKSSAAPGARSLPAALEGDWLREQQLQQWGLWVLLPALARSLEAEGVAGAAPGEPEQSLREILSAQVRLLGVHAAEGYSLGQDIPLNKVRLPAALAARAPSRGMWGHQGGVAPAMGDWKKTGSSLPPCLGSSCTVGGVPGLLLCTHPRQCSLCGTCVPPSCLQGGAGPPPEPGHFASALFPTMSQLDLKYLAQNSACRPHACAPDPPCCCLQGGHRGQTLLHVALEKQAQAAFIQGLLQAGADPRWAGVDGWVWGGGWGWVWGAQMASPCLEAAA